MSPSNSRAAPPASVSVTFPPRCVTTAFGSTPRNEYRPRRTPPDTLSSKNTDSSSAARVNTATGVSRSDKNSRCTATRFPVFARASNSSFDISRNMFIVLPCSIMPPSFPLPPRLSSCFFK